MRGNKLSGVRGRRTPAYAPGKSETGIFPNWLYLRPALPFAGTHFEPNVKRLSCGRWAALAFLHDPQVLTIYDCYSWRSINVYWQWKFGEGYHANSATYYVGEKMADDDWRLTINGTHYRAPFNTPIDGTADCPPDTAHLNNALPTANNWSNNDYKLTINGNQYTYTKEATGGQ